MIPSAGVIKPTAVRRADDFVSLHDRVINGIYSSAGRKSEARRREEIKKKEGQVIHAL